MDKSTIIRHIKLAIKLLSNDMLDTGMYGKLHDNHKINVGKKAVANRLKSSVDEIFKLVYEDKNVYIENSIHSKNDLLNDFLDDNMSNMDLETYKTLKSSVGHFITKN